MGHDSARTTRAVARATARVESRRRIELTDVGETCCSLVLSGALSCFEQLHAELPVRIGPDMRHLEVGRRGQLGKALERVLVAALGPQVLAATDLDALIAEVNHLIALADEMHLDTAHV